MGVIRKKTASRPGEAGVKFVCDVCSIDVTSTVRIRCAHETCKEYDLCVECFAAGKTSHAHRPESHPYRVIEQNSFPIFDPDWGADEELLLLEGCETFGLGSWAHIADHIGGYRTKEEVRDHYLEMYVNSSKFPLPERCGKHDTRLVEETSREEFQAKKKRRIEERKEATRNAPSLLPKPKPTASVPSCHEIQGYMPGRLEFEYEYANEAEEAVQLMQFDPGAGIHPETGEVEPETELKLTVMNIYNTRLTQRAERKRVIFEHNLLDYRENIKQEKKRSKEEKELYNKVKPFARLMNRHDFDTFCQGLIDELNLRQAIAQLQEWRRLKIPDLQSGERYEQEKIQRIQRNTTLGSMDRDRLSSLQRSKGAAAAAAALGDNVGGSALLIAPTPPSWLVNTPVPGVEALGDAAASAPASLSSSDQPPDGARTNSAAVPSREPQASPSTITPAYQVSVQPLYGVSPFHLTPESAPDLHLLTPEEVKLCESVRLQPKPYLMIKEQILREALKSNGTLKKKQAKEICRLETQKGGRIFDFFIAAGWVGRA